MPPNVRVFPDSARLARAVVARIVAVARSASAARGRFALALSGGSTPRAVYAALAEPAVTLQVDWNDVHLFFGDERCVPPDHADSNYRMVQEALFQHGLIPASNIHRLPTELPPAQAAEEYERDLRAFFGASPQFDLALLGLGDDGHTASLFPDAPALAETERWVTVVEHTTPPPPLVTRLTLTLPVFQAAREILFLVAGANKAERLAQVLTDPDARLPAQFVHPTNGELMWWVDEAAAKLL